MSQALCFNDVQFDVIPQNSQPWVRSPQIAEALGYGQANRINDLYARHADEFTDAMTAVITLPTEGGPQETRIFSLRGCHLLAMFARTPVAKSFRRWVLDVLDKLAEQERARLAEEVKEIPDASRLSKRTDPERKQLTAILNTWVGMAPIHYANARAQVNAHFGVTSVDRLTVAQVRDAIQWVQAKIDAIPPVALPPSPGSVSDESRQPIYRNGALYMPHKNRKHVAGPREKALRDFWDTEYHMRAAELKKKFREMMDAINAAAKDGLYAQAISNIGKDADTMFSVDSLLQGMYTPESMAHAAFKEAMELACLHMRMATSIATALNM